MCYIEFLHVIRSNSDLFILSLLSPFTSSTVNTITIYLLNNFSTFIFVLSIFLLWKSGNNVRYLCKLMYIWYLEKLLDIRICFSTCWIPQSLFWMNSSYLDSWTFAMKFFGESYYLGLYPFVITFSYPYQKVKSIFWPLGSDGSVHWLEKRILEVTLHALEGWALKTQSHWILSYRKQGLPCIKQGNWGASDTCPE